MSITITDEEVASTFSASSSQTGGLNRVGTGHMHISISEDPSESYPPEAVQVRNTFIHVASPSAPGEPECPPIPVSCPAADIGWIHKLWEEDDEPRSKPVICLEDALALPGTPEPYHSNAPANAPLPPPTLSTTPMDYSETKPWQLPLGSLAHGPSQTYSHHSQPPQVSQISHPVVPALGPTVGPSLGPTVGPAMPVGPVGPSPTQPAPAVGTIGPVGPVAPPPRPLGTTPGGGFRRSPPGAAGVGPVGAPVARGGLTVPVSDVPMIPPSVPAPYEPAPGSLEMPSIGSKGHYVGDCRPCAFLHAKGCHNGAMCLFCHLCDRGEKKRRQKAKKASFRGGA